MLVPFWRRSRDSADEIGTFDPAGLQGGQPALALVVVEMTNEAVLIEVGVGQRAVPRRAGYGGPSGGQGEGFLCARCIGCRGLSTDERLPWQLGSTPGALEVRTIRCTVGFVKCGHIKVSATWRPRRAKGHWGHVPRCPPRHRLRGGPPIIPVGILGSRDVSRPSRRFSRPGAVHVAIGDPIPPSGQWWSATLALRDPARAVVLALSEEPDLQ
jgi:hypothetical protein